MVYQSRRLGHRVRATCSSLARKVLQVPKPRAIRRIGISAILLGFLSFSLIFIYSIFVGVYWRLWGVFCSKRVLAVDITAGAFGLLIPLGPPTVEMLSEQNRNSRILAFAEANGTNGFAIRRIAEKSPNNVVVRNSRYLRFLLKLYKPGSLAHPVVSLWSHRYLPRGLTPEVYPSDRARHLAQRYYSPQLCQEYFRLTAQEFEECKSKLQSQGLNLDQGFVCFNARDDAWRQQAQSQKFDTTVHQLTNVDIETFVPAISSVLRQGWAVIRVGRKTEKTLRIDDSNFFDYANSSLKSDVMDFFLAEYCVLAVSTGTGWDALPRVMSRPVHLANFVAPDFSRQEGREWLWCGQHPPISVGFKRSFRRSYGSPQLGFTRRERQLIESGDPDEAGQIWDYCDQSRGEIESGVNFALRLALEPEFLADISSRQATFQRQWHQAYSDEDDTMPTGMPLIEPSELASLGDSLLDESRWARKAVSR